MLGRCVLLEVETQTLERLPEHVATVQGRGAGDPLCGVQRPAAIGYAHALGAIEAMHQLVVRADGVMQWLRRRIAITMQHDRLRQARLDARGSSRILPAYTHAEH